MHKHQQLISRHKAHESKIDSRYIIKTATSDYLPCESTPIIRFSFLVFENNKSQDKHSIEQ